jgi:hypothetical protein
MEKNRLLYSINRFDHYFESVNNKTAVYIALNTFILGGIITGYITVQDYILKYDNCFNVLLSIEMLIGILTLVLLIYASIPYFSKDSKSLYYFGSIGSQSKKDFIEYSKNIDTKQELKDLRNQVYTLSIGLNKKFVRLKIAGKLIVLQFILLIPLIIILLMNKF